MNSTNTASFSCDKVTVQYRFLSVGDVDNLELTASFSIGSYKFTTTIWRTSWLIINLGWLSQSTSSRTSGTSQLGTLTPSPMRKSQLRKSQSHPSLVPTLFLLFKPMPLNFPTILLTHPSTFHIILFLSPLSYISRPLVPFPPTTILTGHITVNKHALNDYQNPSTLKPAFLTDLPWLAN